MQALARMARGAGYQGCALALDELEITQSLPRNLRERVSKSCSDIDALDGGQLLTGSSLLQGLPCCMMVPGV